MFHKFLFSNSKFVLKHSVQSIFKTNRKYVGIFRKPHKLQIEENYSTVLNNIISKDVSLSNEEWSELRKDILNLSRSITNINIDATILGYCAKHNALQVGKSYIEYLKSEQFSINVGAYGKLLKLYYAAELTNKLLVNDKLEILRLIQHLEEKYEFLDPNTLENVIHGLCATNEWEKSLKYLDEMKLLSSPSASTYSAIIYKAFLSQKINIGWMLLEDMIKNNKVPKCKVFVSWIKLCRSMDAHLQNNNIEKLFQFIGENNLIISKAVYDELNSFFNANGKIEITKIAQSGMCLSCKLNLKSTSVTAEEFGNLSKTFIDKVLIRKDIFLKSNPVEFDKFEKFLARSSKFDIIIDGLNVAYSAGNKKPPHVYAKLLGSVVKYFSDNNRKILILGRKHMSCWPKIEMNKIKRNASLFLTDDISQDDPYILYAAIKNGPFTDFFSRDLMRSHSFLLGNGLQNIFRRWQQEHQYSLIHANDLGHITVKEPTKFCISAHKIQNTWHLPYNEDDNIIKSDLLEASKSWVCVSF